jgi:hypothetical protein
MIYYLAAPSVMNRKKKTYNFFQLLSALGMMLALLWLTVSTPFVYASQLQQAKQEQGCSSPICNSDEESNPFGNSTEEKTPSSTSFSEEYLHDTDHSTEFFAGASPNHLSHNAGTYIAFHGELLGPPPNVG